MANKPKLTAEYFPHFAAQKKTVKVLKSAFGSDGYACWYQLLEMLCSTQGHFIDCNIPGEIDFLASEIGISAERMELILRKLIERGKFDRELWEGDKILWCQSLTDNLSRLYSKRISLPEKPKPSRNLNFRDGNNDSRVENSDSRHKTTRRIVKERIVKDSKEKHLVQPPSNPEFGRLSNLLFQKILDRNPNHKTPNTQNWEKQIRLMVEADNRDPEEIEAVIIWCQEDYFWQNNILSTEKLRKHYDRLILKMNSNGKPKSRHEENMAVIHNAIKTSEAGDDKNDNDQISGNVGDCFPGQKNNL